MFGAEAADTVRAAAKRRMKSWKREAIVDIGGFQVLKSNMWKKERFDNQKKRKQPLREKMSTTIMDSQSYYKHDTTDGRGRARPIHCAVQYEPNLSLLASSPILYSLHPMSTMRDVTSPQHKQGGQELDTRAK